MWVRPLQAHGDSKSFPFAWRRSEFNNQEHKQKVLGPLGCLTRRILLKTQSKTELLSETHWGEVSALNPYLHLLPGAWSPPPAALSCPSPIQSILLPPPITPRSMSQPFPPQFLYTRLYMSVLPAILEPMSLHTLRLLSTILWPCPE